MPKTTYPMSEKQQAFIKNLLAEREGSPVAATIKDELNKMAAEGGVTSKAASAAISHLLAVKATKQAYAMPEPGYYTVDGQVFVIVKAKDSDHHYAKKLTHVLPMGGGHYGRWVYVKGAMKTIAQHGVKITLEDAAKFGHLHGFCIVCGKTLTDPKSVQAGIGPICAKKF